MEQISGVRRFLTRILIIVGIALLAVAMSIEIFHYPWGTLLNTTQDESSISDPAPIELKGGDANKVMEEYTTGQPKDLLESGILPGAELDDISTTNYVQSGILKIPKLNVSQYILEGTQGQLHYGVGHVIGTKDIGATGNCVISGHRATAFRYLNKLSVGDSVVLKDKAKVYTYSVYDIFEVQPDETWVLSDIDGERNSLTLITCTPYLEYSDRLIVRTRLANVKDLTP